MKFVTAACCAAALFGGPSKVAMAAPQIVQRIALEDGGWDILTVDPNTKRVLISRSNGVDAVDMRTGQLTSRLISGTRFHGVTVVPGTPIAVATQATGSAVIFNSSTDKILGEVKTDADADATVYEPHTRSVWVMNGDSGTISIVDPIGMKASGKINVGGSLEFPALDGRGHLFVNVEDKHELVEVDIRRRVVSRRLVLADCEAPTGLVYLRSGMLISACRNGVAKITRATDLKPVGELKTGPSPDGAFADEARHRAYIPSGGDGTLSVIDTESPLPRKIATVQTQVGARTGTVDLATGTVYLPTAKFGTPPAGGGRPPIVPGSVELLVVRQP